MPLLQPTAGSVGREGLFSLAPTSGGVAARSPADAGAVILRRFVVFIGLIR